MKQRPQFVPEPFRTRLPCRGAQFVDEGLAEATRQFLAALGTQTEAYYCAAGHIHLAHVAYRQEEPA